MDSLSLWVHMRNFPLIIKPFIQDTDDEVFSMSLLLVDITNRITAAEIREYEVEILEEKIIEFLDKRKDVFESFPDLGTCKPKHHFIVHYPQAIRLFGPPLSYWTARWESKHRVAKNTAESAKNFKNISFTVSVRQQMRMASVYYKGMFETNQFTLPEKVSYKQDLLDEISPLWIKVREFMRGNDLVCSEIVAYHQNYKKGDLVVLEVLEGGEELRVGLIEIIVVKKLKVFFMLRTYIAAKQLPGYFQSVDIGVDSIFTPAQSVVDYKPLIMHGTVIKFQFVLHHHLSCDLN